MDTIPWGLLKVTPNGMKSARGFQWILFLGAYLKVKTVNKGVNEETFQWILFLGAYLKVKSEELGFAIVVSVDTIPWGLLKV